MAENGGGASGRRKEDHRFLTGKGSYTDDLNVVGQTHAYFVRSPHAHATINNINTSAALAAALASAIVSTSSLIDAFAFVFRPPSDSSAAATIVLSPFFSSTHFVAETRV